MSPQSRLPDLQTTAGSSEEEATALQHSTKVPQFPLPYNLESQRRDANYSAKLPLVITVTTLHRNLTSPSTNSTSGILSLEQAVQTAARISGRAIGTVFLALHPQHLQQARALQLHRRPVLQQCLHPHRLASLRIVTSGLKPQARIIVIFLHRNTA
jgi:hypothetical protein